jgi:hypothetical protein
MERRVLLLLVGPKGAGKTFVGGVLERHLGIAFLRIEPIFLGVMRGEPELAGIELERRGFQAVLEKLDELARSREVLCIESTGTARTFPDLLAALRRRFDVRLIRVRSPLGICLERIRTRDASVHIPVSDDRVMEINEIASRVELPWDLEIDNTEFQEEDRIVQAVRGVL